MIKCFSARESGPFVRTEEVINPEVRVAIVGTGSDQVPSIAMKNYENRLPMAAPWGKQV